MAIRRFTRQEQTMRPATASKRLENEINQWLARISFERLSWTWEEGARTPLGGPNTLTAIEFEYEESPDGVGAHYQVKAFLPPPGGPTGPDGRPHDVNVDFRSWFNYAGQYLVDRIDIKLGSTFLEAWVLFRRDRSGA
ncbi:MAG: hypothetical protein WD535_04770 [Thermaerobacterales bacterium]